MHRVWFAPAVTLLTLAALLPVSAVALAQEAAADAAPAAQAPAGVSTLVLLLGIGAVLAVAVVWFIRERSAGDDSAGQ